MNSPNNEHEPGEGVDTLPIPLSDLRRQHQALRPEIDAAIGQVLDRCDFIRGQAVQRFEAAFARTLGTPHALGVGSGTDALYLALVGLGLGPGDEVITAANSFAATAEAVVMAGGVPVFADVDDETLCLSPASVERVLTARTRALIPVHLHGRMADMEPLSALATEHGLWIVEDAAQAHGARQGEHQAGTVGQVGCFSFFPSKNLGACGDGGLIATSDPELASRVRMIRDHGRTDAHSHVLVGQCSRLDTIQAAVLLVKLPHLAAWNARRRDLARAYDQALRGCPGLRLPPLDPGAVFHHYVVRTRSRDALMAHLQARGIGCGVHYAHSIPEEPAFRPYRTAATPVSDQSCREVLSLPLFPEMTDGELLRVARAVCEFFGHGA